MTRRGLHTICTLAFVCVGAASGLAQNWPAYVAIDGMTGSFAAWNGTYVNAGPGGQNFGGVLFTYRRYSPEGTNTRWVGVENVSDGRWMLRGYNSDPGNAYNSSLWYSPYVQSGSNYPTVISNFINQTTWQPIAGSGLLLSVFAGPDGEYYQNFPDWASAAVKIPLGFGLAMSFWACAVAASISMRWVRDLASAAS